MDRSSDETVWSRLCRLFRHHYDGEDLEHAVIEAQDEGELEEEEGSMILNILQLDELQVQDIMTPRTDFDCLPSGTSVLDTARNIAKNGHSRLPIYNGTRDNIVGIAYAKDLFSALLTPNKNESPVDEIMRQPFFVPETKAVSKLLQEFRARKNHIAIVVDEYGGTSGLVTIEDVIEVIVGDIEDEHDAPKEEDIIDLGGGRYQLSGRAWLEDLHDLGIHLEAEDVDTIGGYLCLQAGRVPQNGEVFEFDNWRFTVKNADVKQIRHVIAEPAKNQEDSVSEQE